MTDMLSVGTVVLVTQRGPGARPPYVGKVVGYDLGCSKYEVGAGFGGWGGDWVFLNGGDWAFRSEVEPRPTRER